MVDYRKNQGKTHNKKEIKGKGQGRAEGTRPPWSGRWNGASEGPVPGGRPAWAGQLLRRGPDRGRCCRWSTADHARYGDSAEKEKIRQRPEARRGAAY